MAAETKERKQKQTKKFRLKRGVGDHFELNPQFDPELPEDEDNVRDVVYHGGEIVESTRPLDKLFVNKFEPVQGGSFANTPGGDVVDDPELDPDKDRPVRSTEDANVRRGERFLQEEELEGKPELQKLAKPKTGKEMAAMIKENKKKEAEAKAKEAEAFGGDEDEEELEEEESSEGEEGEEMEDMSDTFPEAKKNGMQVLKDGEGKMRVYEEGSDEPMKGSKNGFTTKKRVRDFIKKHAESEEE